VGLIARHQTPFRALQRLLDPVVVVGALWSSATAFGWDFERGWVILAAFSALTVALVFEAAQVYRAWRSARMGQELGLVVWAWAIVAGVLFTLAYAAKTGEYFPRRVLLTWLVTTPVLLVAMHAGIRLALRTMRVHGRNLKTYVIVGGGDLGRRLHERISSRPWLGMRALGYFADRVEPRACQDRSRALGLPHLGAHDDLAEFAQRESLHYVYVALPPRSEGVIRKVMDDLADSTASVYLVPDISTFELLNARTELIDGLPVIGLRETPFSGPEGMLKRTEDLVLASIILLLISPLMAAIALAVRLTSPGPVMFKQRRYGLDGRIIRVYKFRTMTVCEDGAGFVQARREDARVTKLGAFLRRTSLDELPQFLNVLQGRMSIVGPRPHPAAMNEQYRRLIKGYMLRHKVRPGITGLAQVNGFRGETDTLEKMEKRIEYDLAYMQSWSLEMDLKIIAQTVLKGFRSENAY
jgi:undecaprenyl-phosphate glucose phosphotransferase